MIIAGNFKTNHTRSSTLSYAKGLNQFLRDRQFGAEVYLFPPMSALAYDDFSHFSIGAQNAYPVCGGAYTGEIGLDQLNELQIKTLMIGHSERRVLLGESDQICQRKFEFFAHHGMNIFLCVGESLEVRQAQKVREFLALQLSGIDLSYARLIVAYEPIWAIGTGVSASLIEIQETHAILKDLGCSRVVYGGSVNPQNAREIMSLDGVDGVLVGGASLRLESFCEIIENGEMK